MCLSCFLPLQLRHMDCRLSMLWSGMPPVTDGEWMWSIVQSLPSSSLWQVTQRGSSIFLANARASRHSLESCQSLMVICPFCRIPSMHRASSNRERRLVLYRQALNTLFRSSSPVLSRIVSVVTTVLVAFAWTCVYWFKAWAWPTGAFVVA
jgi:hypothetical protein